MHCFPRAKVVTVVGGWVGLVVAATVVSPPPPPLLAVVVMALLAVVVGIAVRVRV